MASVGVRADEQRTLLVGNQRAVRSHADDGAAQALRPFMHQLRQHEAARQFADRIGNVRIETESLFLRRAEHFRVFVDGAERPDLRQQCRAGLLGLGEFRQQGARGTARRHEDRRVGESERPVGLRQSGNDPAGPQRRDKGGQEPRPGGNGKDARGAHSDERA